MPDDEAGRSAQGEASDAAAATAEAPPTPEEPPAPLRATATVEEIGPCARLLKVQVPQGRVHEEVEKSYNDLRKTVFLKGFRPGHIPRHVLERRFGEQVADSVKQSLVEEALEQVVEDKALRLALPADVDLKALTLDPKQPLAFEAKIEVVPNFTIDNYKGLTVERPLVEVTDADVANALESFRRRQGKFTKLEEGQVAEGDVPICHAIAIHEGKEIWREVELPAFLDRESVAGIPAPGLKAALLGAKVGDTRSLKVKFPDNFEAEEHRGKEVDLEVTVDEIRRLVLPEATDEWARSLRFDDLDDLRDELRDELRRNREQDADDAVHERIAEKLLELTDFDVPEGLVERLVAGARDRQRLALLYRGVPQEQIGQQLERVEKQTRDASVRQCKLYFIYERIAEAEKIFVTEDEVQQRIQAIALNYRRRPEDVASELEREGRLSALRHEMREEKVRDFLVRHAIVTQAGKAPEPPPAAEEPEAKAKPEGEGS